MTVILQMCNPERMAWMKVFHRPKTRSLYMLPFVGVPLLCFYLDRCIHLEVTKLIVIDMVYDPAVAELLENYKCVPSEYRQAPYDPNIQTLVEKYQPWITEETLIFSDCVFPRNYHCCSLQVRTPREQSVVWRVTPDHEMMPMEGIGEAAPSSLQEYTALNLLMLHSHGRYELSNYARREELYAGSNVHFDATAEIHAPVFVSDEVYLGKNVLLEESIVGPGCAIGDGAHLKRCIVFRNSEIGPGVCLEDKIVDGNRIVAPRTFPVVAEDVPPYVCRHLRGSYVF